MVLLKHCIVCKIYYSKQQAHRRQRIEKQKPKNQPKFVRALNNTKTIIIIIMKMCAAENKEMLDTFDLSQLNEVTCESCLYA